MFGNLKSPTTYLEKEASDSLVSQPYVPRVILNSSFLYHDISQTDARRRRSSKISLKETNS